MRKYGHVLSMNNHKSKHIGIFLDGVVWHYSNTRDGVAKDQEKLFITKFKHATFGFHTGRFLAALEMTT